MAQINAMGFRFSSVKNEAHRQKIISLDRIRAILMKNISLPEDKKAMQFVSWLERYHLNGIFWIFDCNH